MLQRFFAIIFWGLVINGAAQAAKPVVNIQHWQLANGAKVYFVHNPQLKMVDINVMFAAGSAYDGKQLGLALLTNNMLSEGTKSKNADQIARQFDQLGARFSNSARRDAVSLSLRSLSDEAVLTPALHLFTDILMHPSFLPTALKRVQQQSLQALTAEQQSPNALTMNAFSLALYGNTPYGHNPLGSRQTIMALQPHNLQRFYQQYYVGKNSKLVIVGHVSRANAEKISRHLLGGLPAGQQAPLPIIPKKPQPAGLHAITFPSTQTTVFIGQTGVNASDPRYFPLLVGNYILGGNPMVSRLFVQLRNKRGLVYHVASQFFPLRNQGIFGIILQTKGKQTAEAIKIAQQTLAKFMAKGPSAQELIQAKQSLIGRFPLGLDSNAAILAQVSNIAFQPLALNYLDTYRHHIAKVTVKQINQAFKDVVKPAKMITVTVGQ